MVAERRSANPSAPRGHCTFCSHGSSRDPSRSRASGASAHEAPARGFGTPSKHQDSFRDHYGGRTGGCSRGRAV
eukprot:13067593-Alexandrium_andersonii.AAC.1